VTHAERDVPSAKIKPADTGTLPARVPALFDRDGLTIVLSDDLTGEST
jgi:hypothetical protein